MRRTILLAIACGLCQVKDASAGLQGRCPCIQQSVSAGAPGAFPSPTAPLWASPVVGITPAPPPLSWIPADAAALPAVTPAGSVAWVRVTDTPNAPDNAAFGGLLVQSAVWDAIFDMVNKDTRLDQLKGHINRQTIDNLLRTPGRPLLNLPK
jgi:hypothetical protein